MRCVALAVVSIGAVFFLPETRSQEVPDVNDVYVSSRVAEILGPKSGPPGEKAGYMKFDFRWESRNSTAEVAERIEGTSVQASVFDEDSAMGPPFRISFRYHGPNDAPSSGAVVSDGMGYHLEGWAETTNVSSSDRLDSFGPLGSMAAAVISVSRIRLPILDPHRMEEEGWRVVPGSAQSWFLADPTQGMHIYADFDSSGSLVKLRSLRIRAPGVVEEGALILTDLHAEPPPPSRLFQPRRR